jgi:choline dehydrogenase-like flavoprotein
LRVADTSIYPDNVMHNTNLTALVVGEMAARFIDSKRLNSLPSQRQIDDGSPGIKPG